ncbi:hypothetical protein QSI_3538 [Clostridioides difficile P28]|nr:hypothetical protein QSI_3538 [Clostridioides difficile P28]
MSKRRNLHRDARMSSTSRESYSLDTEKFTTIYAGNQQDQNR